MVSRNLHHVCLINGSNDQLNMIWRRNIISFPSKFKLHKTLVTSILIYGCEIWTLFADSEKRIQAFETKHLRSTSLHLLPEVQDQQLGMEQDQLPCGASGTFSGNCQKAEIDMVRACHTSRHPLHNHSSGHLGGWVMLWLAEEILDGQHQKVDIPTHAGTAHKGLPQK